MSEDNRVFGVDTGGENASATDMALSGASRPKADAFLEDQRRHLHEQARHLREQLGLKLWELRMGVFLRLATLIVGLAVASGVGLMVWDAAHSKNLLIEPFSVPPDMAQRGLTGEVVATQMLDKLATMTATESSRAVQSYANNWGNNIKVEIPETGVSIGELERYLRGWLGHDIRISGEIYRTADGIAVTARTGGDAGATYTGKESDLDALVKKAAEHVYEITQPYRFANYLDRNYAPAGAQERVARAAAIYRKLIAGDDPVERAWAWNGLGTIETFWHADNRQAAYYYRKAMATVPEFTISYYALAARNGPLGQEEEGFQNLREASRLLHRDSVSDLNPHYAPYARLSSDSQIALAAGDFATAIAIGRQGADLPDDFSVLARGNYISDILSALARSHDGAGMRAYLHDMHWKEFPAGYARGRLWFDMERQDWRDVTGGQASLARQVAQAAGSGVRARVLQNAYDAYRPYYALAHAHLGDFAGAEKLIAPVPSDRDMGLRAHAIVAELQGQHARADWWFARSEAQTPSIPLTDLWWGQALVARGQPDAAIEKFKLANQKGPKFADPLEGWGEALMAKNQSHLALEKFAGAEKYAPNWGRLHLKWGEALRYAGKTDEAKAQLARAAQLDLTPSEKSELSRQGVPHA